MDEELTSEAAAAEPIAETPVVDLPGPLRPPTRRAGRGRSYARDIFVPLLALAAVFGAIFAVEYIRNGRNEGSSPAQVFASDGFTPLQLGVTGKGRVGIGQVAPRFQLTGPGGTVISTADLAGKPAVLNFWATWCAPCRREIPDFVKLAGEWGDSVELVGVDMNEPSGVVAEYAKTMGMNYPLALDLDGSVTQAFKLTGLPETFFIDSVGVIRDHRIGAVQPEVARCIVAGLQRGDHLPDNCR